MGSGQKVLEARRKYRRHVSDLAFVSYSIQRCVYLNFIFLHVVRNTFIYHGDLKALIPRKLTKRNILHASNSQFNSSSNNTMNTHNTLTTATTIIKLNTNNEEDNDRSRSECTMESARENGNEFETQFVHSESNFNKQEICESPDKEELDREKEMEKEKLNEKEDKQGLDDNVESAVMKLVNSNTESSGTSKSLGCKEKANFSFSVSKSVTSTKGNVKIITVNELSADKAPAKNVYSKGFTPNKLTQVRATKSAAPVLISHPTVALKTSKPMPFSRVRTAQTTLIPKTKLKNFMELNSEFQNKWNEDLTLDDVRILEDSQMPNNSHNGNIFLEFLNWS